MKMYANTHILLNFKNRPGRQTAVFVFISECNILIQNESYLQQSIILHDIEKLRKNHLESSSQQPAHRFYG